MSQRVAVIGSGPGGALTAALLAEAGHQVEIFEEGGPAPEVAPYTCGEIEHKYRCGGITAALGRPKVTYVEGRTIGGGSEINSGLYHRLPQETLEHWRKEYQLQIENQELQNCFELNERELQVRISKNPADIPAISRKLQLGADRLGWQHIEVPRWYHPGDGARHSMSEVYIPRALRHGGRLRSRHHVQRLRQNRGRWEVQGLSQEGAFMAHADSVILACGAIQTSWLLRRSGWRSPVGRGIHLHPTLKVVAEFSEDINQLNDGVSPHQIKKFSPRLSLGCSISRPQFLALGMLDHRDRLAHVVKNYTRHAVYYVMLNGHSHGRVYAPLSQPLFSYDLSLSDGEELFRGLQHLSRALYAAGAVCLYPSISQAPMLSAGDLQFFTQYNRQIHQRLQVSTFHLMGGCALGENSALCGADSQGRVRGAENLWVNDGSMLCTSLGVNPQGSIMALARRNAHAFLTSSH